jgi:hypothetical protein
MATMLGFSHARERRSLVAVYRLPLQLEFRESE